MNTSWFWRVLAVAALASLAACGDGGGSDGGGGGLPIAGLPSATSSAVTLTGTATYESVPNTTGPLAYSASVNKPVRGAIVEVLNGSSTVLATTTTDAGGAYSVSVPANTSILVRVKAQSQQGGSGAGWDVSVRDNTQSEAIYAMESPTFSTGVAPVTRDLRAPSGWDGASYASRRVAGPFALLDTVYETQQKVLSVASSTVFPPLRVFWSVNNVPAVGNAALGQIRTTSFVGGSSGRAIYVLGKENVDTDEYDTSVIAHEWGHYYQSAFSRDDSPGGSHSPADLLDRRVAFSEGWGNAWSGIALARSNYTDSVGPAQSQGSNANLTIGPASNPGWFRETSIQSILWNLNSQAGFKPIHDTLISAAFKGGLAVTSVHPFTAAFNAAAPASASALTGLLAAQNISANPNDPFGNSETNNGGVAVALPMYRPATVGGITSACVEAAAGNKLGNFVYLRFTATAARNYTITVEGGATTDPDFVVYRGGEIARANAVATTEVATVGLQVAEYVLAIKDFNNTSACFNVSIQ